MDDKKKLSEVIDSLTDAINILNDYLKDEAEDFEEEDDIIEIIDDEPEAEEEKEEVDVTEEENKEEVEEGFFDALKNKFDKKGQNKSSNTNGKKLSSDTVMFKAHRWLNDFGDKSDIDKTRSKLKAYIDKEFPSSIYTMDDAAKKYVLTDGTNYRTPQGVADAAFNSWRKNQREAFDEDLGSDIDKYQEWVDYDMDHYGKVSARTNQLIRKAGLELVQDKYGDYEVIGKDDFEEGLVSAGLAGAGALALGAGAAGAGAGIANAVTKKVLDKIDTKNVKESAKTCEECDHCKDEEDVDEGLGDLLNPLAPVKAVGNIVGKVVGGLGEGKEECSDEECQEEECDEGLIGTLLNPVGALSKAFGEEKECDHEKECADDCDEGLLGTLLNPIGAVSKVLGEKDCTKRDKALTEAKLSDYEDKFNFRLSAKLAEQLFYRDAYILVEPSEIAYEEGCRVIYVGDDQMIHVYNEAADEDVYEHYVESDIDVDSELRKIFQNELDLYLDEIGDIRIIKRRYYR